MMPRKGKLIVWELHEFRECRGAEERADLAWAVPDHRTILCPENVLPIEDPHEAAEAFAEYFHNQRDGYEITWPCTFVVSDGTSFWEISVDRDYEPTFRAGKPVAMEAP